MMTCAACRHDNPPGSAFCEECGAPFERRCPSCGSACAPTAKFCRSCGASLVATAAEPAAGAVIRKVVTIVFADLIGSTSLHERLDPESVTRVMDRYYQTVRGPVEAHGGTVVQLLGDGVMCAFGVPRVAEDDALRAVQAAVAVQRAFRDFAEDERALVGDVGLRVAVNTGEVVVSDEHAAGIGDPLNVAARLQQEGGDGDVLVGESTQRLVADRVTLERFGTFALRGRAETVTAYRVVSLERPSGVPATAFVGRDDELRRLGSVYEAAVAERRARLAVVLGSPGLGKSRLLAELTRRLEREATVLTARCDAAGEATFAPLAEALRVALRLDARADRDSVRAAIEAVAPADESARIAAGIGALLAATPAAPEETFFVVRRLLAALAAARPLVLAIDDLQWAEPLLLDLTEHLVQWSTGVPLLVLGAARPELRDARSALATRGDLVTEVVTLGGLDAGAAMRLAANVVGADELPAAITGRVLATSEGNPLFVGELVRMLVHDGVLRREGERWTTAVAVADLEMPPTIQALLAARIERLRPEERAVLERAAVIGRQFSRAAVAHLLPRESAELDARLEGLRRSELIERDAGWFLGEPVLRFHHVLIRDAAYRRVLKGTRADLHARVADWIEARAGDAAEHDEIIGWHLEQAHQNLRELGPLDAHGRSLGERAALHLAAAGRRALARDDVPVAASLLGRALDRLDAADPARAELTLDWCEALLAVGDVAQAARAVDELGRFVGTSDRLRAWHTCFAGQLAALTDPKALHGTADAVAAAAGTLAAADDATGEAKAHSVHAIVLARLGKVGECEAALDRALAAARRAGDRRRANAVLAGSPLAALWGPSPVTRASGRCLDVVRVLRITASAPAVEAVALRCQAVLEALRGRTDAARRMLASSRRMVEELGIMQRLLEAEVAAGQIELFEGDAAAAEHWLEAAYDGLRTHGLRIDAAQAAAPLGRALLMLGRYAEAETLSHESEALAGDDLRAAVGWRCVRAEALARRGEHATAVELARAAVAIASGTDALLDHADARRALGVALRAAGRGPEADAEELRTIELWEAKGATLLVERARRGAPRVVALEPFCDADRGDEALAPFDELTAEAVPARVTPRRARRVQATAATATATRYDAALVARDIAAYVALLGDEYSVVHHWSGTTYDRELSLADMRAVFRTADDLACAHEPLATLGDSLALFRRSVSATGVRGGDLSIGATAYDNVIVIELDRQGLLGCNEVFAENRLGDATARLYERYAGLLPDGPARTRAAATARSVATVLALPRDADRYAKAIAADIAFVDHQPVGIGSARSAARFLRGLRALHDLADDVTLRIDDVLALRPDGLVTRQTTSGTLRAGGGTFERHFLSLWVFGPEGLVERLEWFPGDRDGHALARFDEVTAAPPPATVASPYVRRRFRPNAATANLGRLEQAVAARAADTFAAGLADDLQLIEHPTGLVGDREGVLFTLRSGLRAHDLKYRCEPIATLGDSLVLSRSHTSGGGFVGGRFDVGAYDKEEIALIEVDAQGRRRRIETFAPDRLADAVVRLYERYAELLPTGAARTRAAKTARSLRTIVSLDTNPHGGSPHRDDIEFVDYRRLGFESARGRDELHGRFRALFDLAVDITLRIDDVLGLGPDIVLYRSTISGTDRASGGPFEQAKIELRAFGPDGLGTRCEWFDADDVDAALARFDELTGEPAPPRFANAAARASLRFERRIRERDWDGVVAAGDPALHLDDRRRLVRAKFSGDEYLAHLRLLFDMAWSRWESQLLATRGERLALFREQLHGDAGRAHFPGNVDGVEFANDLLVLVEIDAAGRLTALVAFDPDDLDAAYAELNARYSAGEGAPYAGLFASMEPIGTFAPGFERLLPDDFTITIHRRFAGTGSSMTRDEFAAWLRVTTHDLHARQRMRLDHILRISPAAELLVGRLFGTVAGGGDFETAVVNVIAHDGTRPHAIEAYDLDQLDVALARYDELTATATGPTRIENAATRSKDRFLASWHARDWDGVAAVYAPGFRVSDRRPMIRLELDPPQSLEGIRVGFDLFTMTWKVEVLATRGERLMLARAHWEGSGGAVGPSEGDMLEIVEVNDRETREIQIVLDPGDLDAAFDELDARYGAGEAAAHPHLRSTLGDFKRAFAARDWDAIVAMQAPDFILHDHRPLGWGTLDGAHYLDSLKALAALAADSRFRTDHVWLSRRGVLGIHVVHGTREGGAFEEPRVTVSEHDERGAYRRMDFYALAQLDEARARFAALRASPARIRTDRVPSRRVRANAATANAARFDTVIANRDADALSTLFSDVTEFVEHTTGVSYDREGVLRSLRSTLLRARDPIVRHEPLATLGDSLTLCRVSWSATGLEAAELDVGAYDMEVIGLLEVDAQGRRRRTERFPADRLGDAVARLYERYAELLPEGPARARAAATARAVAGMTAGRSNPDRYAAALAPAAEVVDHRMLGTWFARGAEAFLEQLRPMEELADEMAHRDDDVLGLRSDALLVRHTHYGTVRASGGAYENQFLFLKLFGPDGRVTHIEFFDPDRDAEALARFDELTAPAVVRFENAASRWRHRILEAWQARDWDRVSSGYAPSYRVIDRRKMMHMEVDRDRALESLRLLFEMRSKFTAQLLATRGDRLELVRSLWRFEGAERYAGPSEVDALRVREVDERGDAVAEVAFDPHDLDAAYAELGARFLAGEGAPYAAVLRTMQALGPAVIARDWERFASAFTSDFVAEDHRPLGFGTLSRDEYMASVRALLEMRPDARLRSLHVLALDDRRSIAVAGWVGAEPEGMFETSAIVVSQYDGTGIWRRADWYAVDHLDEAWARFAELRFDPLRIPPNAATRTGDRHREVVKARDMDALARLCVPTMVFDDRRRSVLLTGDLDVFLASSRVTAGSRIESTLLATAGDRLALSHCRWSDPAGTKWDLEVLSLDEVDAEGRTVAIIAFDADDRRAAGMEMFERFARSDEARSIPDAAFEGLRAVNAHDLDRLRAVLPDDFFMDDHRRTGLGRLDRETYLASLAALFEQAPDMTTENLRTIAVEPHGFFVLARNFGTLRGGGALESVYLRFTVYQGDRMGRVEMFEPDDLEIARARFEELASAGTRESAA